VSANMNDAPLACNGLLNTPAIPKGDCDDLMADARFPVSVLRFNSATLSGGIGVRRFFKCVCASKV
jgi:hypothetical protein